MELAERRPAKIEFSPPISIENLFPARTIQESDTTTIRIEQVCQLGRHFIEIRRWMLEGDAWVATPDHVRINLDAVVRTVDEINGINRRAREAQQRFEKLHASPSIRGVREVDELIKFIKKKLKRNSELQDILTRKIIPGLKAQSELEAGRFLVK